jgi:hypothetical protein
MQQFFNTIHTLFTEKLVKIMCIYMVNTVTQHVHDQEAGHPNGAQRSRSTQKIEEGQHKNINNDVLKGTNDNACSIIDPLHKKENNVT